MVKLTEVLYVPWIRQWYRILHSQEDATGVADMCYSEGTLHFLVRQILKRDDTSTGAATRAACCGSLLEGLRLLYAQARWTQGFLSGSGRRGVKSYIH
jgi:hypothetical protein